MHESAPNMARPGNSCRVAPVIHVGARLRFDNDLDKAAGENARNRCAAGISRNRAFSPARDRG
jgi:hypothetical protein